jgi:hypothetical protein
MAALGMGGFLASAALHLATFAGAGAAALPDAVVLGLFAGAFLPLIVLLARSRAGGRAPAGPGGLLAAWRQAAAAIPPGARLAVGATAAYALMNLVLSLLLALEQGSSRPGELRLLSGQLLLLYLLPLVYFVFVDRPAGSDAGPPG